MKANNSIAIFSEIVAIDQGSRSLLAKVLPKGMELSHFSVLNLLVSANGARTPAQLANALHVSRGAMTNTLAKLEKSGDVHIQQDWEDARQKNVSISDAGRLKRDIAIKAAEPILNEVIDFDEDEVRRLLSMLRQLRQALR